MELPFPLQVCGVSSKQQQSLLQMHFQGLHLFTGMVYDFAQSCQVPSGNQEICLVLGSELWGFFGFRRGTRWNPVYLT